MKFEWLVASRYLRSRRKQSFISIISIFSIGGVALGIASVIIAVSVMHGFEEGLKEKFIANEAHITIQSMAGYMENDPNLLGQLEAIEGIKSVSPVIYNQLAIQPKISGRIEGTIHVKGIEVEQENRVTEFSKFVDGSIDFDLLPPLETGETIEGGIILGKRVADRLNLDKGDVLRLISGMEPNPANPSTFFADVSNLMLIGFYESGVYVYDNAFGFVSLEVAQKLYQQNNKINLIEVRCDSAEISEIVKARIRSEIQLPGNSMPIVNSWMDSHAPLFNAMKLEKIATMIVETLIILVASFNIASTLIMMVMEKTSDIGILRAIGSSKKAIRKIFVMQGVLIGVLGTISGTALGLAICWLIELEKIRPSRWLALLILIPIFLQTTMRIMPKLRRPSIGKTVMGLWVFAFIFLLYLFVRPIEVDSQVYQLGRLHVKIDWFLVVLTNLISLLICWLATLYPAFQAGKLNPVEAVRYE